VSNEGPNLLSCYSV